MTTFTRSLLALAASALLAFSLPSRAQDNPNLEQGVKPYGDFHGGNIDAVNLGSGGLSFAIEIWKIPQRGGLQLPITLRYNSKMWNNTTLCGSVRCSPTWMYGVDGLTEGNGAGQGTSPGASPVYFSFGSYSNAVCSLRSYIFYNGIYIPGPIDCTAYSPDGSAHVMGRNSSGTGPTSYETIDNSAIYAAPYDNPNNPLQVVPVVEDRNGISTAVGQVQDADGNYINFTAPTSDTRGVPVLNPWATPTTDYVHHCADPSSIVVAYQWLIPGYAGQDAQFYLCYTKMLLQTNFPNPTGTTIAQFSNNTGNYIYALHSVAIPTGDRWVFTYDSYGDVTKITFPTGATLSYEWDTYPLCAQTSAQTTQALVGIGWTPESRFVISRTLDANDGTGPHKWTYAWAPEVTTPTPRYFQVTVRDPMNNDTVHTETGLSNTCAFYETKEESYQGLSTASHPSLLRTVVTDYTSIPSPANNQSWSTMGNIDAAEVTPYRVTTSIPTGDGGVLVKKVETDFDQGAPFYILDWSGTVRGPYTTTYGTPSWKREYDHSKCASSPCSPPSTPSRKTHTIYMRDVNSAYERRPDLVYSVEVLDGNDVRQSFTQYGYDEAALASSGITTNISTTWLPVAGWTTQISSARGHMTSQIRTVDSSGSTIKSCNTYYDTGMLASSTDWGSSAAGCAGANATSYTYDAAYAGAFRTGTQKPTTSNGQAHSVSGTYDLNTGVITSVTDVENSVTSRYEYNDSLARMTKAKRAADTTAETWTLFQYPSLMEIDINEDENSKGDGLIQKASLYDGVGRILNNETTSDPAGTTFVTTTYDNVGRIYTVTNPYRNATDVTADKTQNTYDALGRKIQQLNPDGSSQIWCYNGLQTDPLQNGHCFTNVSTVTAEWVDHADENGNDWQQGTDGLGRLTFVAEPSGAIPTRSASVKPNLLTYYTYDPLGNLISVSQLGNPGSDLARVKRSFNYDMLSRLLCASNPESAIAQCSSGSAASYTPGTVGFIYDKNGNLKTRTDARGFRTTYGYDELNRLLSKAYALASGDPDPNNTPSSCFQFDKPVSTASDSYPVGRSTLEWTQIGSCPDPKVPQTAIPGIARTSTVNVHDALGRVTTQFQCTPATCAASSPYSLSFGYNLANELSDIGWSDINLGGIGNCGVPMLAGGATPMLTPRQNCWTDFSMWYDTAGHLQSVAAHWKGATQTLFSAQSINPPAYAPNGALMNGTLGSGLTVNRAFDSRLRVTDETDTGGVSPATFGTATVVITGQEQIH